MERLTKAEEPIMLILWKLKKAFVKDIINELSDPKPPYNTVSSIIRILEEKEMVDHHTFGKTYQYYPLITRSEYGKTAIKNMVSDYFDGSVGQAMSLLMIEKDLSHKDLEELKELIKKHENE